MFDTRSYNTSFDSFKHMLILIIVYLFTERTAQHIYDIKQ